MEIQYVRNLEGKNTDLGSAFAIISQHKVTGIWDCGSWETTDPSEEAG